MYGKMVSACVLGIDGALVEVETDISSGLPFFQVVGLPDSAVRESTERVRAALKNAGFMFPLERITVNLAPADVRKEGSAFDLAIAAGILTVSGQMGRIGWENTLWIGELSLDGTLRPVPGVLSMVHAAAQRGYRQVVLPESNLKEALLIKGVEAVAVRSLQELRVAGGFDELRQLRVVEEEKVELEEGERVRGETDVGEQTPRGEQERGDLEKESDGRESAEPSYQEDYADVCGQHQAKRALMIAAAGFHNLVFIGPPGTGKTMLIRRLPTILPEMEDEEALEVTKIYSVAGKLTERGRLIRSRPFRAPHHTVSAVGLIGGGSIPKPGEVSLAHRGVLFLDELPEFGRGTLEVLRQPLEDRHVTIGRARAVYSFPAHVLLAASMNPCPCGYYGSDSVANPCTCSPLKILQYRSRISGPLLDRIDMHVEVPRTRFVDLSGGSHPGIPTPAHAFTLSSAEMRARVLAARRMQEVRYKGTPFRYNGELSGRSLRRFCRTTAAAETLLGRTFEALGLSVRSHDRILKLARTVADLEGCSEIQECHVAEAVQYRNLDKGGHGM